MIKTEFITCIASSNFWAWNKKRITPITQKMKYKPRVTIFRKLSAHAFLQTMELRFNVVISDI